MASSRSGSQRAGQPREGGGRVDVERIRFEREPIAGGLWRHRAVRFVIDLVKGRRRPRDS